MIFYSNYCWKKPKKIPITFILWFIFKGRNNKFHEKSPIVSISVCFDFSHLGKILGNQRVSVGSCYHLEEVIFQIRILRGKFLSGQTTVCDCRHCDFFTGFYQRFLELIAEMVNWIVDRNDEKIIFLCIFLQRLVRHRSGIISFTEMHKFLANKKCTSFWHPTAVKTTLYTFIT